jgi:peptidoglycan/LPS O-acetylase OafA/YrhL
MSELVKQRRTQVGALDLGIMLFTLITAVVHIYMWTFPDEELRIWFLLNGIGYVGLLIALYLPQLYPLRQVICYVMIAYAALTVVLYIFLGQPYDMVGVGTKIIEVLLIAMLLVKGRQLHVARHYSDRL